MAKFQNKQCAGETIVFAWVGPVQLDSEGFFEIEHEQLAANLKKVKGFVFIEEEKKAELKVEPVVEPKAEPVVEPKAESKPEPKTKKAAAKAADNK